MSERLSVTVSCRTNSAAAAAEYVGPSSFTVSYFVTIQTAVRAAARPGRSIHDVAVREDSSARNLYDSIWLLNEQPSGPLRDPGRSILVVNHDNGHDTSQN